MKITLKNVEDILWRMQDDIDTEVIQMDEDTFFHTDTVCIYIPILGVYAREGVIYSRENGELHPEYSGTLVFAEKTDRQYLYLEDSILYTALHNFSYAQGTQISRDTECEIVFVETDTKQEEKAA